MHHLAAPRNLPSSLRRACAFAHLPAGPSALRRLRRRRGRRRWPGELPTLSSGEWALWFPAAGLAQAVPSGSRTHPSPTSCPSCQADPPPLLPPPTIPPAPRRPAHLRVTHQPGPWVWRPPRSIRVSTHLLTPGAQTRSLKAGGGLSCPVELLHPNPVALRGC